MQNLCSDVPSGSPYYVHMFAFFKTKTTRFSVFGVATTIRKQMSIRRNELNIDLWFAEHFWFAEHSILMEVACSAHKCYDNCVFWYMYHTGSSLCNLTPVLDDKEWIRNYTRFETMDEVTYSHYSWWFANDFNSWLRHVFRKKYGVRR